MDNDAFYRGAREQLDLHGLLIQGAPPARPFDPIYCYTVGMQRMPLPQPELIAFNSCMVCAADLLSAAEAWVWDHDGLPVGDVVDLGTGWRARVDRVLPRWVRAYAGVVARVLERDPSEVPMVQLVLSDAAERWPEDEGVDAELNAWQPLLACDPAWSNPIEHDAPMDLGAGQAADLARPLLAVPILGPKEAEGRFECLRVDLLDEGRARIHDVPWLADHVSFGAIVEARPAAGARGLGPAVYQMGAVLQTGWDTISYRLAEPDKPTRRSPLAVALRDLVEREDTHVATSPAALHVNTLAPGDVDRILRPAVRDGMLAPRGLHCEGEDRLAAGSRMPDP